MTTYDVEDIVQMLKGLGVNARHDRTVAAAIRKNKVDGELLVHLIETNSLSEIGFKTKVRQGKVKLRARDKGLLGFGGKGNNSISIAEGDNEEIFQLMLDRIRGLEEASRKQQGLLSYWTKRSKVLEESVRGLKRMILMQNKNIPKAKTTSDHGNSDTDEPSSPPTGKKNSELALEATSQLRAALSDPAVGGALEKKLQVNPTKRELNKTLPPPPLYKHTMKKKELPPPAYPYSGRESSATQKTVATEEKETSTTQNTVATEEEESNGLMTSDTCATNKVKKVVSLLKMCKMLEEKITNLPQSDVEAKLNKLEIAKANVTSKLQECGWYNDWRIGDELRIQNSGESTQIIPTSSNEKNSIENIIENSDEEKQNSTPQNSIVNTTENTNKEKQNPNPTPQELQEPKQPDDIVIAESRLNSLIAGTKHLTSSHPIFEYEPPLVDEIVLEEADASSPNPNVQPLNKSDNVKDTDNIKERTTAIDEDNQEVDPIRLRRRYGSIREISIDEDLDLEDEFSNEP